MDLLQIYAKEYGVDVTQAMAEQFRIYEEFLVEYNEKVNLTAITEHYEVVVKHFLDSLLLLKVVDVPESATLIDIGTGAGFPGIPLKIVRPDLRLTLLDSLNKRLVFLDELTDKLGIDAKLFHGRAEDTGRESPFRDGYQLVVARAVTNLSALCEYCLPHTEIGGQFVAYKGPEWEEELEQAKKAIKILGGRFSEAHELELPDGSSRSLLVIDKIKETPAQYPRRGVRIARNPL